MRRKREIDLSISPLLPSVPLSGSDKALGLHEINALLRITPCEEGDDLFSPPWYSKSSMSTLTLSDLDERVQQKCCFVTFAHYSMRTPLSSVYSVPGSIPELRQRVNCNILEFLNCYWALLKASAIIWSYAFPKSLLGLASCVASYFLVLSSIHVIRMGMKRWRLYGLLPAPTAGLILKRNIFLAFVVQFALLSIVGWGGLRLFLEWLLVSASALVLHAALRRPTWHIKLRQTSENRSSFARTIHDSAASSGAGHHSKDTLPPEGLMPLLNDCRLRSGRFARRHWKYFRGWAEDVVYVWQYALRRWWAALKQRRCRRRVLQTLVNHARKVKRQSAPNSYTWPQFRRAKKSSLRRNDDHLYL
eukprot:jgi/Ulvmu1/4315/UM002_0036.1